MTDQPQDGLLSAKDQLGACLKKRQRIEAERDRLKVVNEQLVEVLEMAAEHCAMFVRPTNEEEALAENIRAALVEARK